MATTSQKTQVSPRWGSHDATSSVHGHPAAASALWSVVIHAKIVSQLMCQRHSCTKRVLRVILWWEAKGNIRSCKPLTFKYMRAAFHSLWKQTTMKCSENVKNNHRGFQIPVAFLNSSALPRHPSSIIQSPFGSPTSSAIPLPLQTQSELLREETNLHIPSAVWNGAVAISEAGADYYGGNVSVSSKFKTEWGSAEQDGTQTRDIQTAPEDWINK